MARPKPGEIHSVVLKGGTFDIDDNRQTTIELGEMGAPTFKMTGLVRHSNGSDVETEFEWGPDNIPEAGAALRLWQRITLAWRGKLRL